MLRRLFLFLFSYWGFCFCGCSEGFCSQRVLLLFGGWSELKRGLSQYSQIKSIIIFDFFGGLFNHEWTRRGRPRITRMTRMGAVATALCAVRDVSPPSK